MSSAQLELTAEQKILVDLLYQRNRIFTVPRFQRKFEWGKQNFRDLWDDIQAIDDGLPHFIGQIILIEKEDTNPREYSVIDGQQRLTTISILFCVLRDHLQNKGCSQKELREINDVLDTRTEGGETIRRLYLLPEDDKNYECIYSGNPEDATGAIKECYTYYDEKLKRCTEQGIKNILSKLLHHIALVKTDCKNTLSAYQVFQTQNDRGLDLSPVDLAKTKLLEQCSKADINEDAMRERWSEICNRLENHGNISQAAPRRPLSHYLIVGSEYSTPKIIKKNQFYHSFTKAIEHHSEKGPESLREFVQYLENQTDAYVTMHDGTVTDYDSRLRTQINNQLQAFQAKNTWGGVFTLYLLNTISDSDRMYKLLRLANTLNVRLNLADKSSSHRRDSIYGLVDKSKSGAPEQALKDTIKSRTPSDEQLIELIKTRKFPRNNLTRYILTMIEKEGYRAGKQETRIEHSEVEIEHVAPRRAFTAKKYTTWKPVLNHKSEKFERYKNRLGNLTLLAESQNARAGQNPFQEKQREYRTSHLYMANEVGDKYNEWSYEQIDERTQDLANKVINIFSI